MAFDQDHDPLLCEGIDQAEDERTDPAWDKTISPHAPLPLSLSLFLGLLLYNPLPFL